MTEASKQGEGSSWTIRYPLKGWPTYLMILVVVSLLLVGVSLTFTDSMVIYAQKDKPDFVQVFFPLDGAYSEENSVRSALFEKQTSGIRIPLPRTSIDHVRIDPANEAAVIVISKIELRHLLGTETYMPNDLLAHAKPMQMIDKFEVIPAGLLIHSTGNDPAFELQLNSASTLSEFIKLCIISVLVSLAMFVGVKRFAYLKIHAISNKVHLTAIRLVGVACIAGLIGYATTHIGASNLAKIENYVVLFALMAVVTFLVGSDKKFLISIRSDCYDFIQNNKYYWIAVTFTAVLSYGFTLTNYSVGVDDESIRGYMDGGLLSQGRFGASHFLRLIFDAFEFLPFWFDFLGVTVLVIANILWSIFFVRMSHGKLNKNYTIVFSCILISFPVIAHLFMFMGNAYSIGFTFLLTGASLLLFSSWLGSDRDDENCHFITSFCRVTAAVIILAISIGVLEWSAIIFLTGMFSGLLFEYVSNDKRIRFGALSFYLVKIVTVLALAVIFNRALGVLYQHINSIVESGYTSSFVLWKVDTFIYQIPQFLKDIYSAFFSDFVEGKPVALWLTVFIYSIIYDFLIAVFFSIKHKTVTPVLIVFLLIGSAFSLNIITGNPWLELRTYIHLAVPVASAFMLLVFLVFSFQSGIERTAQGRWLAFMRKGMKIAAITAVVLVVLYQTKELNRLFYFEYLRYEADVRTANNIMNQIERQTGSLKKPVVFIGPFTGSANIRMGYVVFDHDRWNIPEKMLSPGRIFGFMRQLGYELIPVSLQSDLDRAKYESRNMPAYPKEGSIHEFDNFVVVKLGELKN